MEEIKRSITEYLNDCRTKGFSPWSIRSYSKALENFVCWLAKEHPEITRIGGISRDAIAQYQMHLYTAESRFKKRLALQTQYGWMGIVLWFFRWLLAQERILINPAASIQLPKRPQRIPRNYLSLKEIQKLLRVPDINTHIGLRNRTMLEVFYCTGIRAGELQRLKTEDLNLSDGWLTVRSGKGGKDRVVPLGKAAIHFLQLYLDKTRPKLIRDGKQEILFVSQYGRGLSHQSINHIVQRTARLANIKRRITPHALRHTCATLMLRGHADIRHIQEMLGHSSLSSTQIYTRVEIRDLKKVHARCHPREKEEIETE
jgi:integrase/recombinase XerD